MSADARSLFGYLLSPLKEHLRLFSGSPETAGQSEHLGQLRPSGKAICLCLGCEGRVTLQLFKDGP